METVKRLAASVRARRTNHDTKPSLVEKGNLTVEIKPKQRSNNPSEEMLARRTLLFQVLFSLIRVAFPELEEGSVRGGGRASASAFTLELIL